MNDTPRFRVLCIHGVGKSEIESRLEAAKIEVAGFRHCRAWFGVGYGKTQVFGHSLGSLVLRGLLVNTRDKPQTTEDKLASFFPAIPEEEHGANVEVAETLARDAVADAEKCIPAPFVDAAAEAALVDFIWRALLLYWVLALASLKISLLYRRLLPVAPPLPLPPSA